MPSIALGTTLTPVCGEGVAACQTVAFNDVSLHSHTSPEGAGSLWWDRPGGEMIRISEPGEDPMILLFPVLISIETASDLEERLTKLGRLP